MIDRVLAPYVCIKQNHNTLTSNNYIMKLKALLFGLLIAGSTALTYTATQEQNVDKDYAAKKVDRRKIKVPTHG